MWWADPVGALTVRHATIEAYKNPITGWSGIGSQAEDLRHWSEQ